MSGQVVCIFLGSFIASCQEDAFSGSRSAPLTAIKSWPFITRSSSLLPLHICSATQLQPLPLDLTGVTHTLENMRFHYYNTSTWGDYGENLEDTGCVEHIWFIGIDPKEHITTELQRLHLLPITFWVQFKKSYWLVKTCMFRDLATCKTAFHMSTAIPGILFLIVHRHTCRRANFLPFNRSIKPMHVLIVRFSKLLKRVQQPTPTEIQWKLGP